MPINDNHIEISKYRGLVSKCPHCSNATLPGPLQTHCRFCLTRGFVAQCLKCDGTGLIKAEDPWGSKSVQGSVCDICGGTGCLPAPKPEGSVIIQLGAAGPPVDQPDKKEQEPKKEELATV